MESISKKVKNASGTFEVREAVKKRRFVFPSENLKRYQFPTHINDLIIDRAESSFSEVFMVLIKPNEAPLYHKHDDTEQIFYIIEGTGVLTVGDQREQFNVKPGDVVRVPLSTLHSIMADNLQTLKYLCVDCFGGKLEAEPTWDDHVITICKTNGWNFNEVVHSKKDKPEKKQ